EENKVNVLQDLEKLLTSKDFEVRLMDFIKEHGDLFKISKGLFDDNELCALLSKLVTQLFATIHGAIKTMLTTSISKRSSIMDALKSIIHSSMEVDSSHWTRFAFLDLFSPYLIPSLHPDLQHHIMSQLHINIQQLAEEFQQSHPDLIFGHQDESPDTTNNNDNHDDTQVVDSEEHADRTDSGFGLQGSPSKWNKQKFWNYVDAMLEQVRDSAYHETGSHSGLKYEDAYCKYVICSPPVCLSN
ncbi:hypothetical protein BDR04DRAFT_1009952, partial [Suillus decipiens]